MSRLSAQMHPLLTEDVLEKLRQKNVQDIYQFLQYETAALTNITKLTYKNILVIRKHILNKNSAVVRRADEYYEKQLKKSAIISTGIKPVDDLLDGGIYTGNIYEICGLPNVGKTQFCLTLLYHFIKKYQQNVLYIDTKCDFPIQRMIRIIGDPNEEVVNSILKKIIIIRIDKVSKLIQTIENIKRDAIKGLKIRLIMLDALPVILYNENIVRSNSCMNIAVNAMRYLTTNFNMTFIITNFTTTWRESMEFTGGEAVVESVACGKYWLHVPNTRLKFNKTPEDKIKVTVLKSCQVKEGISCEVQIRDSGMV